MPPTRAIPYHHPRCTDQARISRIENAGDNPSYGLVERIAKALELELWELAKQAGELEASD
jgi:transcriptional regulator with XRE-family HTH domain